MKSVVCAAALAAATLTLVTGGFAQAQAMLHVSEGTEVRVQFDDHLSSATATVGDKFSITTVDAITLPNGVVLPAGLKGAGEVTTAEKRGMMGKGGQLNVRLNYMKVGDAKVRLRASKGAEGKDSMGATVALTVLFGPLGLLKHGRDVDINPGQTITGYVDSDADVPMPLLTPAALRTAPVPSPMTTGVAH